MIRALMRYVDEFCTSAGACWILALNSILLIPLIFAVFFYPVPVLIAMGVALVLTLAAVVFTRAVHAHRHP
jgi:hypothetical protein